MLNSGQPGERFAPPARFRYKNKTPRAHWYAADTRMKPQHKPPQPGPGQQAIQWQGKTLPLGNACALALAEHSRGNTAAAVDIYALVLQRVPTHAEGHNNRGVMLQFLQRHEEALVCYDRALALRPDYLKAHFNRGTVLSKLRRGRKRWPVMIGPSPSTRITRRLMSTAALSCRI